MAKDIRLSRPTLDLLGALLESPSSWQYGYDLSRRTALKSGTLYPILMRLAERGWLEAKWEFDEASGRPRHVYRLTGDGRRRARAVAQQSPDSIRRLRPQPAS
jgi:DNA-binding PadR family transcriptional regulator